MAQPTFAAVRQAVADYITSSIGLRATSNRFGAVSPPMAVIVPQTGSLIRYGTSCITGAGGLCSMSMSRGSFSWTM